eukprot:386479-Pelagomonas_calceolata.AAC.1
MFASGKAQLNQRSNGAVILDSSCYTKVIIDSACHTLQDGVQGHFVVSVWVSEAMGAESGNVPVCWAAAAVGWVPSEGHDELLSLG